MRRGLNDDGSSGFSPDRRNMAPNRPIVRYHGGKWRLAPWILGYLPAHRVYVEPFGGGASVLLQKPRSYAEIYNDRDREIVNLFRVARDHGEALVRALELTPFARDEFADAYVAAGDPIEQARRTLIRSFQGFGSAGASGQVTGFRANSDRSGSTPSHDWMHFPAHLRTVVERLRGVVIENRDALDVMRQHDGPDTVHYVDPPYVHGTRHMRARSPAYRHELSDLEHRALADCLATLRGTVILSGYRCKLYDDLFAGWRRVDVRSYADGARKRTESLWLSRESQQADLFSPERLDAR